MNNPYFCDIINAFYYKMTIELISFRFNLNEMKRLELMINIVNQSQSDLILFCGHTLKNQYDLEVLADCIKNKTSFVLFEMKRVKDSDFLDLRNCLYTIENGCIRNLFTNQFFSTKAEIEKNESLCERFINELKTRRHLNVKGKNCLVLQCGEINIIKSIQKEGNRPIFRHDQRKDLEEQFYSLIDNSDIILNPIHTPMGNQGKMEKRREFLSKEKRYYFSVSQNGKRVRRENEFEISINSSSLQYSFYDGKPIKASVSEFTKDYQKKIFII